MMDQFGYYDSFAVPSLNLRPEELDKLDASQIDPLDSPPSIDFDIEKFRDIEASIDKTVNAFNNKQQGRSNTFKKSDDHANNNNNNNMYVQQKRLNTYDYPASNNMILTPPSSQQTGGFRSGTKGGEERNSLVEMIKAERDKAVEGMQRVCDQRIEAMEQDEKERIKELKEEYEEKVTRVNQTVAELLKHQEQVFKTRDEAEKGFSLERSALQKDLRKEREARRNEKEKYQRMVKDLKCQVSELEKRLKDININGKGGGGRRRKTLSFSRKDSYDNDDDDDSNDDGDSYDQRYYRDQDERVEQMKRENDMKIANLVRHFEKEKTAALEILKSKVRAEISLLLPRIKEQCHRAYSEKVKGIRDALVSQFRQEYGAKIKRMREEHSLERRLWQKQLRERVDEERQEIAQKLKAKYELRILDLQNECERKILQRLRDGRKTMLRDESFEQERGEDTFDTISSGGY